MKNQTTAKMVSIGIPIYRRLEYLPNALRVVSSQDYPSIELIVSDNGTNGSKVRDIVQAHYSRPWNFRQNPATVNIATHFNQILNHATGEYFVLLMDDDEFTPNYVSELVHQMEQHPEATIAFARQEIIDKAGEVIRRSRETLPNILSGPDFIRAAWQKYEFGFECLDSFLARTEPFKASGGYLDFVGGNHSDNAAVIKLCLSNYVVFGSKCAFRWRYHEASYGWSVTIGQMAAATRQFIRFLDSDPAIREFAVAHPVEWAELKRCLMQMAWETYFWRWKDMYKGRCSCVQWTRAAFAMPFIAAYYRKVGSALIDTARARVKRLVSGCAPAKRQSALLKGD